MTFSAGLPDSFSWALRSAIMVYMKNHVDIVKDFYSAINRNDVPAALISFDSEVVRIEFENSYRGLPEVKEHFTKANGTWAEGSCEPEKILTQGNKVIAFVHVRVRLKDKTDWIDGRTADVFTFRDGKVIEMRLFLDSKEALEWAGVV